MIVWCGTSNPGKLREFQLEAPSFEIRAIAAPAPDEDGATFEENARLKAMYYGALQSGYVFADDSGLEVDALGGEPGVHSARFAGPSATDRDNNDLLLSRLRGVPNRTARFVCVIALVTPRAATTGSGHNSTTVHTFRAAVEGRIIDEPRGTHGFGYDPLFFFEPFGCTFGEASDEQKMQVSHRAQALRAMFAFLDSGKSQS
jgi:XTP/dITP diphosphohydrolase